MQNLILLYNPKAGNTAFRYSIDRFIEVITEKYKECEVRIFRSKVPGDMGEYLSLCDLSETQAVFVAGGSGTVNEVASALVLRKTEIPLGIIPAGMQNELARKLGFSGNMEEDLKILAGGHTLLVDAGSVNGRFFFDSIRMGTLESITNLSAETKKTFGKAAYYVAGVRSIGKLKRKRLRIESDIKRYTGSFAFFTITNTSLLRDDEKEPGQFTLVASKNPGLRLARRHTAKTITDVDEIGNGLLIARSACFRVEALEDEGIPTEMDGENGPELPLEIDVIPNALRLICREK